MTVYMKVSRDEYQLPVAVADTMSELARMCGVTISNISHALKDSVVKGRKSDYLKVEVDDD